MIQPGGSFPTDTALERLLSETYIRLRQGKYAEATERLARAKELAPDHPRVIEIEGDLFAAQGKPSLAEKAYRRAHEIDPSNAKLEEKFATALLKVKLPGYMTQLPDDSPWSNHVSRLPIVSVVQSMLLPGLGQLYNGDWLKGMVIGGMAILCDFALLSRVYYAVKATGVAASPIPNIMQSLFTGPQVFLTLFLLGIWIYAMIDAGITAK